MKEIKGKVKRAVQILWENKYRMTYYMLILCILFGCIHYAESGIWSSANISFNYSEASLGLSPNKTRFNAYEIVSEEVMQRAIEKVGLQGSISASELAGQERDMWAEVTITSAHPIISISMQTDWN